ncbi:MAG: sugar transferase [Caulobacteraceae bacterium]|nr:sugar transferase [Caulobacteraceae bacterium]
MDIVGALIGLVALAPFLLLAAALIVLESPGHPLFAQRRTGLNGSVFHILKFRTMTVRENGGDVVQAIRGDQRVTRLGRLLRRTSFDELPQLINVLRGEMSLVGPRPHALAHDEFYGDQIVGYRQRFQAKPGMTGLAQVSGLRGPTPDIEDMAARVAKDRRYILHWSFWLDVKILFHTMLIFAFHEQAI